MQKNARVCNEVIGGKVGRNGITGWYESVEIYWTCVQTMSW